MTIELLTDEFINGYDHYPKHMTPLGQFVYLRTYSRYIAELGRRETWRETCRRAVEFNVQLAITHLTKIGYAIDYEWHRTEAELLFDNMFNLKQFLSGRTLWVGGADNGVAEKYPLSNFNCSFLNIKSWEDMCDLFYLLMVGTGCGFKTTKQFAESMPPIRVDVTTLHSEYKPVPADKRLEKTHVDFLDNGFAKIYIGDSKEGWVEALRQYFRLRTDPMYSDVHTVKLSYNSVRQRGERLKTFGGTASGWEPLREMFEGIDRVLRNQIDPSLAPLETVGDGYSRVRPIHIIDIANLIGNNVVVGGVRRTAEIALFDSDDWECILAKYAINGFWKEEHFERHEHVKSLLMKNGIDIPAWFDVVGERHYDVTVNGLHPYNYGRPLHHRRMSNNSITFESKPTRQMLNLIFEMMQLEGEPGFFNLESARRRRPNSEGTNPCGEILLDSYGVCNLTTVNLMAFVSGSSIDFGCLVEAQRLSARAGLRMTLATLELPHWDGVQQRDRLLGTSLTGVQDAIYTAEISPGHFKLLLDSLRLAARSEADSYAKTLRVSSPLLVTTVKPEGTLSQVAGGISSGLHYSHSPYHIRRIRISASDPLAKAVVDLGWPVQPEVGTIGEPRTLVVDFPVKSGSDITKDDISAAQQLETYFTFQQHYTEHNSSNTITVRPHEWSIVEQIVWERWDDFTGVSFLALDGGSYELAPYETITESQYEQIITQMVPLDIEVLRFYDNPELSSLDGADGCDVGACPIR